MASQLETYIPLKEAAKRYSVSTEALALIRAAYADEGGGWTSLTRGSRDWIAQELAQHYPGLGLRHPDWNNLAASWDVSYYDDMTGGGQHPCRGPRHL